MPTETLYYMDENYNKIEQRLDKLENRFNEMDSKLDRVLDSLQGNGIAKGFVQDINDRTKENETKIFRLEANGFTEKERERILHVVSFFEGWKLVLAALVFITPVIALVLRLVMEGN